jgi:Xaa-Pro aminopeptidase
LQTVQSGEIVGVDPRLISLDSFQEIEKSLSPNGASLKAIWENLVDKVWDNKPIPSKEPAIVLPTSHSGRTVEDKLNTIRNEMKSSGVGCVVLSALDEIACSSSKVNVSAV